MAALLLIGGDKKLKRIFTDGACSGNPGPGGWACIILHDSEIETLSGGSKQTTNNRMELMAIVESLKYICLNCIGKQDNDKDFLIVSDSAYVVNAINLNWITVWKLNGWKTTKGQPTKNRDLWQDFIRYNKYIQQAQMKVTFEKVKGHNGNSFNELADDVAKNEVNKIQRGEI